MHAIGFRGNGEQVVTQAPALHRCAPLTGEQRARARSLVAGAHRGAESEAQALERAIQAAEHDTIRYAGTEISGLAGRRRDLLVRYRLEEDL